MKPYPFLSMHKRKYLVITKQGIENALEAIEKKDYAQAYRELDHIHNLPTLIIHFEDFDKDIYEINFYSIYMLHSKPEYSQKIKGLHEGYKDEKESIPIDDEVVKHLKTIYRNIIDARGELNHLEVKGELYRAEENLRTARHLLVDKLGM